MINKLEIRINDFSKINKGDFEPLEQANIDLEEIRENTLEGHQIRSRYQHYKAWKIT